MGRSDWIGLRVARWRDTAGMTQQEVAERIGVTQAYISQIENGHKPVTKRSRLVALATALGVRVEDLLGQPYRPRSTDELYVYATATRVRAALDEELDGQQQWVLEALAHSVDTVMAARMACDYGTLAHLLPELIRETRTWANADRGTTDGLRLFVRTAICAALTLKPFGYIDLAMRLAERAQRAAELAGDPVDAAAAEFTIAQSALAGGSRQRSYSVAAAAAARLGGHGGDDTLTWFGMLHLHAALTAASLPAHAGDVDTHLAEAQQVADRVTADPWRMEFSPTNVAIWRVGIALENGAAEHAPELARRVDTGRIRTKQRRARLHIDAGRGHYLAGQPDEAVRRFLQADQVAPNEVRSRPSVREIVGQMVRDARRAGGNHELRELAVRVGIDPLDPPDGELHELT